MKRYTGQQALYEAISRSRAKAKQGGILEKLKADFSKLENPAAKQSPTVEPQEVSEPIAEPVEQASPEPQVVETQTPPQTTVEHLPRTEPKVEVPSEPPVAVASTPVQTPEPVAVPRPVESAVHPAPPSPVRTWLKPRPVQLNEGRIEISVPYHIGAVAGLVLLLVIVVAYRLGGSGSQPKGAATPVQPVVNKSVATTNPQSGSTAVDSGRPAAGSPAPRPSQQDVATTVAQGDNWIVLAQSKRQEDFGPVIQHFRENGISLNSVSLNELRQLFAKYNLDAGRLPSGDGFLLVTADFFENPRLAGTNGYKMLQKIIEVGARYKGKAPSGYESFAPNYFSDAYPMKMR